jgi:hypothetical protein
MEEVFLPYLILPGDKLDFIQLRGIAERFSEVFEQCARDF